jgi:NhaP-type Na+/H+ or K+/H+ antiporter
MTSTNRKALDFQEKFEFYSVSLTFTLLALSIQSASSRAGVLESIIEVAGWIALLTSGLVQLFRLQLVPVVLRYEARRKAGMPINEEHEAKAHVHISVGYKVSWISFICGLLAIILSRSIAQFFS